LLTGPNNRYYGLAAFGAIAACVIALFALVVATIQVCMFRAQLKQGVIAAKAALAAAESSQQQAIYAKTSADISTIALTTGQRAWIKNSSIANLMKKDGLGNITHRAVNVVWKNYGPTPGKEFRAYVRSKWFKGDIPEDFDFLDITQDDLEKYPATYMFPQGIAHNNGADITIAELIGVWQRTDQIIFCGVCEYNDVFPGTPRHRTEFCFKLMVMDDPRNAKSATLFATSVYGKHNTAT